MTTAYQARPIKRHRRTKTDIELLRQSISGLLRDDHPMTIRQLFYRMVSNGTIEKSEAEYQNVVIRLTGEMRLDRTIPFGWISDATRWMRKPATYLDIEQAVEETARFYRRDIWADQDSYVEVWLEKEALAGVVIEETDPWHVPLMVTRGYPSLTYLYNAAEAIRDEGKPAYLYYLGDHDPSGLDISRNTESRIREFAPEAEIHFERIAITPEQIEAFNLPTRPTKKTDTRAKNFVGGSIEVDAIAPADLRSIVAEAIERHIDTETLKVTKVAEESEREMFAAWRDAVQIGRVE